MWQGDQLHAAAGDVGFEEARTCSADLTDVTVYGEHRATLQARPLLRPINVVLLVL